MKSAIEVIANRVNKILMMNSHIIMAIDGRCASGKTTLASQLAKNLDGIVIHMDDYFLQEWQRTPVRLSEAGGNVDYERFRNEVLIPLYERKSFYYRPYNCKSHKIEGSKLMQPQRVTIIEGSYSCHPSLWDYYDYRIFMTVDSKEQLNRLMKRDPDMISIFKNRWIPMEEHYFAAFNIRKRCDDVFEYEVDKFCLTYNTGS